jgi:predicted GNAT family N-acyltransferase
VWQIQPIHSKHDVSGFDCGKLPLTGWLKKHALANDQNDISKTHVALLPDSNAVWGYYALSSVGVIPAEIPDSKKERIPQGEGFQVPCILLGRLAIDTRQQKKGLGATLLAHALQRALESSRSVAAYAVVVDAIDEEAKAFYLKYGFIEMTDDKLHLMMHMRKVRETFAEAQKLQG